MCHWSEAFYKNKTLVIGKKFRFEIIFQNGELGHFTKRRINRIRIKTFVITNSMKGNILWVDIYRSTYFFERMLSTSCSFFNILFPCQKSTPQKLFLALQTDGRTGTLSVFLSIALLSFGARIEGGQCKWHVLTMSM